MHWPSRILVKMPQLSQKDSDDARKRKREMIERIPAMTMAGSRRNKDMVRLKQDLEERARINMMKEAEGKSETMYVDVTRNVGVVLGEIKRNLQCIAINCIHCRREGFGERHKEAGNGREHWVES